MSQAFLTADEFRSLGLPPGALVGLAESDIARALSFASARASGYLGKRFRLPLASWGDDSRGFVAALAAWTLLARRGFNPEMGADTAVRKNAEDALRWLDEVARGLLEPEGIVDASPVVDEDDLALTTDALRGW